MVQQFTPQPTDLFYPDSDGQPMADNTLQFEWIVTIKENLEIIFADDPTVFVAGDLLWYPVKGDNITRRAPDAMVAFGRPKGYRGSYKQWEEENIAPQVVFEILSPGNTIREMAEKLAFYQKFGVEEYYLYNPYMMDFCGWQKQGDQLILIDDINHWVSPRLGIKFESTLGEKLKIFRPDGSPFLTSIELERERKKAESERDLVQQKADRLAAKLRELGINPDEL